MTVACFNAHGNGKYTTIEEAAQMVYQMEVSIKYRPITAEALTVIKEAIAAKIAEVETCETAAEVETLTRYERIKAYLDSLSDIALIQLHNAYCEATNNPDNCIYPMDDFDEIIGETNPWEIARMCFYGHEFNPNHEWFYFNGYGNLESLDYINDSSPIYTSDIAHHIDRTGNALDDDEIAAILEDKEVE